MKKVCTIIPTLNEEDHIGALLDSLQANTYANQEIIVVDDGSTDKTVEIVKSKGAKLLVNQPGHRGPAFGWNRAAQETGAEVICILGADFLIKDKTFLEKGVKAFDEQTLAVHTAYQTTLDTFTEKVVTEPKGMSMEPRFYNRRFFLELGGFPEIGFGEDAIMNQRLKDFAKQKNLKIKRLDDAFFSGHGVHSIKAMLRQARWYGKTSLHYLKLVKPAQKPKAFLTTYLRLIYFLSFLFLPLSLINLWFLCGSIPFFMIFLLTVLSAFKKKNFYALFRTVYYLIFGLGLLYGLLIYFFIDQGSGY